jgi:hypothetical protein
VCEKSEHVGVNAVSVWSCSFFRCFFLYGSDGLVFVALHILGVCQA